MSTRDRSSIVVAVLIAGALMSSIVFLLVRQGQIMTRMESNTAAVKGMVVNTREMIGLLGDTVAGTRKVPVLEREARPFFRSGKRDLHTTAKGMPRLDRSLTSLNATAQPAFQELGSGALRSLPAMAGDLRGLAAMPAVLDRRLSSLDTLLPLDRHLRVVAARLSDLPGMHSSLRAVSSSVHDLPQLSGSLAQLLEVMRQVSDRLASIDQHVASLDLKTVVIP